MQLAGQADALARRGVQIVAISVDSKERSASLAERLGVPFPLLSDPTLTAIEAYGVAMAGSELAVPATFVVDRDRRILRRYVGETQFDRPSVDFLLR